jgi:hypothetical protein
VEVVCWQGADGLPPGPLLLRQTVVVVLLLVVIVVVVIVIILFLVFLVFVLVFVLVFFLLLLFLVVVLLVRRLPLCVWGTLPCPGETAVIRVFGAHSLGLRLSRGLALDVPLIGGGWSGWGGLAFGLDLRVAQQGIISTPARKVAMVQCPLTYHGITILWTSGAT